MRSIIDDCEQAARVAAKILLEMQGKIQAREKSPADLVTEADIASQQVIAEFLGARYPEFGFLGEEKLDSAKQDTSSEFCWIVDPLDGTTNYVHGLDNYCISIALRKLDRVVAGVVHDPVRDEMFSSVADGGAFLNGRRLKSSDITSIDQALVAASFSARVSRDSVEIKRFVEVLCECQALRRMGSAALNLCYLAAGRIDGYWATSVKVWDVAAGVLLIQEAGGTVSAFDGGRFDLNDPKFIAAGNGELHGKLLEVLKRVTITNTARGQE